MPGWTDARPAASLAEDARSPQAPFSNANGTGTVALPHAPIHFTSLQTDRIDTASAGAAPGVQASTASSEAGKTRSDYHAGRRPPTESCSIRLWESLCIPRDNIGVACIGGRRPPLTFRSTVVQWFVTLDIWMPVADGRACTCGLQVSAIVPRHRARRGGSLLSAAVVRFAATPPALASKPAKFGLFGFRGIAILRHQASAAQQQLVRWHVFFKHLVEQFQPFEKAVILVL